MSEFIEVHVRGELGLVALNALEGVERVRDSGAARLTYAGGSTTLDECYETVRARIAAVGRVALASIEAQP